MGRLLEKYPLHSTLSSNTGSMKKKHWVCRDRTLEMGKRALVMGIVNVTPDSFSDGGQFLNPEAAIAHGLSLVEQGADILDIGAESSRPGSMPVSTEEELLRIIPVVTGLARQTSVPLSIDTTKAEVARRCLSAGAYIINDITALQGDPAMIDVAKEFGAGVILMHMQGTPATMQLNPRYEDVVREIGDFLAQRIAAVCNAGLPRECISIDPGIGFGKTSNDNLLILRSLDVYQRFERPLCLGVSRKGFIGQITKRPVQERIVASLAVACYAVTRGAAQILRVHDVAATVDAVKVLEALRLEG
jgi:dihydropteroate synthase